MDVVRGLITAGVAIVLTFNATSLPDLNTVGQSTQVSTNMPIYVALAIAALLMGFAEVLRDNSAQTLLPSVISEENLESANGKLWSTEYLMNSFIGPPVGSFLLGIAVFLPLYIDAGTFFVAAALISSLATISRPRPPFPTKNIRGEVIEGFRWLWSHSLFRPMAIILGLLNLIFAIAGATYILFAQEILRVSVFEFALLGTAGAIGGSIGGIVAPRIVKRIGSGPSLYLTLIAGPLFNLVIGLVSSWQIVWILVAMWTSMSVLWNVVTVSLRQTVVPTELLGRVNSVYRFFGWGSMPIGIFIGGTLVWVMERVVDRNLALRTPYFLASALGILVFLYALPRLTTAKIEATRDGGFLTPSEPKKT